MFYHRYLVVAAAASCGLCLFGCVGDAAEREPDDDDIETIAESASELTRADEVRMALRAIEVAKHRYYAKDTYHPQPRRIRVWGYTEVMKDFRDWVQRHHGHGRKEYDMAPGQSSWEFWWGTYPS